MERRSSAFYQRRHRDRLREQGLVKKELWVLPEYADELSAIERRMRRPQGLVPRERAGGDDTMRSNDTVWTAPALYEALATHARAREGAYAVELIDGAEPGLYLTMHDYGDLPLFMAVVGRQIVVEALLWPVDQIDDQAAFNEEVLRTHKLFPLSTLGIEVIDGEYVYIMFGALSSTSSLADVLFAVESLVDNTSRATEAYAPHLRELREAA